MINPSARAERGEMGAGVERIKRYLGETATQPSLAGAPSQR
jgi:hypothetical protein